MIKNIYQQILQLFSLRIIINFVIIYIIFVILNIKLHSKQLCCGFSVDCVVLSSINSASITHIFLAYYRL